jgi:hypothetical protein
MNINEVIKACGPRWHTDSKRPDVKYLKPVNDTDMRDLKPFHGNIVTLKSGDYTVYVKPMGTPYTNQYNQPLTTKTNTITLVPAKAGESLE